MSFCEFVVNCVDGCGALLVLKWVSTFYMFMLSLSLDQSLQTPQIANEARARARARIADEIHCGVVWRDEETHQAGFLGLFYLFILFIDLSDLW
jgi:hypothetical protein